MNNIANKIIAAANESTSLLNWDHEVHPTPKDDFIHNLAERVRKYAGWDQVVVDFNYGILIVECASNRGDNYRLCYDSHQGREHHGRLSHLGLGKSIGDICKMAS